MTDLYGKRKMQIITLAIYSIGLTGCALTYSDFICLVAFRAMQGIGPTVFRLK